MTPPRTPSGVEGGAEDAPPAPRASLLLGLLFVSASLLLLQVTWTRVLSVTSYYHFAFLVVGTSLLGFGASGVLVALSKRIAALPLERGLLAFSLGQAASILLGFLVANRLRFAPFSLLSDPSQIFHTTLFLLCLAAPFTLGGLAAALLLRRLPARAGRLYFFDLVGAGSGCLAIVLVMPPLGASGVVLLCAALAVAAGVCFSTGWTRAALAGLLCLLSLSTAVSDRVLPVRISPAKVAPDGTPMQTILESRANLFTAWNTFSRIDVLPAPSGRQILIDAGTAMTRMPRVRRPPNRLGPISDEQDLALVAGARQSVLVVGSGGGWEVLAALRQGARRVVAVEVNPIINRLVEKEMAPYVGRIFSDPRVELVTDEARSFIRRSSERFDAIVASHTISNAATASGAMSLAESYTVTVEAFVDYLEHLTPTGVLFFTRPEPQLPRLATTCREALARLGVADAASRVVLFAGRPAPSFSGGMLLGRSPLGRERVLAAARRLEASGLRALHLPGLPSEPRYAELLGASPPALEHLLERDPMLRPATDDRPFFNQRRRFVEMDAASLGRVFREDGRRVRMSLEDQPVAEAVLVVLLCESSIVATILLVLPLLLARRAGLREGRYLLGTFFALGLGYILVEIALTQRLALFVGQPVFTFAVVVGALLLSSSAGSLLSTRLAPDGVLGRRLVVFLALSAALVLLESLAIPSVARAALAFPLPIRALLAALLIAPLGLSMGTAFPTALRHAGARAPALIPWAFGLNAVASVVGSSLAVILATSIGFSGVLAVAAATYLVAALFFIAELAAAPATR
jgi:hypothetical protein